MLTCDNFVSKGDSIFEISLKILSRGFLKFGPNIRVPLKVCYVITNQKPKLSINQQLLLLINQVRTDEMSSVGLVYSVSFETIKSGTILLP